MVNMDIDKPVYNIFNNSNTMDVYNIKFKTIKLKSSGRCRFQYMSVSVSSTLGG